MAPREFYQLLEDRLISGLGVLAIPQEDTWRAFRVWTDIVRFPTTNFQNFKWNPNRSEYAKLTWMQGEYVWKEEVVNYERQSFDYFPEEPGSYLGTYLVCSLQSLSNALASISVAVGLPPPVPGDPLYAEPIRYEVDYLRFSCREESAFQVRLYGLPKDIGCVEAMPNPKRNLPPSTALPVVNPGDAIEVSAPYVQPDDNGNTIPYTGDPLPAPPPGNIGITTQYRSSTNCAVPPNEVIFVWEDIVTPVSTNLGGPICTDSNKWSFSPTPIGYFFDGTWITPGVPTLWNGSSNFDEVNTTPAPITIP